jgi:ATP phosphoribosyltransferase regulatory subunit
MALGFIKSKNAGAISALADEAGVSAELKEALVLVTKFYGSLEAACAEIKKYIFNDRMSAAYRELCEILDAMGKGALYVDFSVVNDMSYYDGIIFNGYVNGISDSILSGGRYDRLLSKMGKKAGAIGFAVYIDLLERFGESEESERYDAEILLVYGDKSAPAVVAEMGALTAMGKTVKAVREDDGRCKYKEKKVL